jgi:hypothetical protein
VESDDGADFVAEFEAAVQQQKSDEPDSTDAEESGSTGEPEAVEDSIEEVSVAAEAAPDVVEEADAAPEPVAAVKAEPEEAKPEPVTKKPAKPQPSEEDSDMPTGDDILAEFAQSLDGESEVEAVGASEEQSLDAGQLDTDKMLEEMADLASVAAPADDSSGLEDEMDTDKMAEEASRLLNGE